MARKLVAVSLFLLTFGILIFQMFIRPTNAAAVTVTVPYSATPVADSDLDGFPNTGAWSDANHYTVDLENAATAPYGTATIYFKHNATNIYIRIDGKIDVAWVSATGNHFWLSFQIDPVGTTGHHKAGQDNVFFGETSYTGVTYPLTPIDTSGSSRPPTKDASQDDFGLARYSGTVAPFNFTAEWERKLNTGDAADIALIADGTTTYSFYVTTDSNGGGSSGGGIDHSVVTTNNTLTLATPAPVPEFPLGVGIVLLLAPAVVIAYLWRTRTKRRVN